MPNWPVDQSVLPGCLTVSRSFRSRRGRSGSTRMQLGSWDHTSTDQL